MLKAEEEPPNRKMSRPKTAPHTEITKATWTNPRARRGSGAQGAMAKAALGPAAARCFHLDMLLMTEPGSEPPCQVEHIVAASLPCWLPAIDQE